MNLTLFINPEHRPGDDLAVRLAEHAVRVRLARAAGFDGITIGHHLSYSGSVWLPPFETLARLAVDAEGMSSGANRIVVRVQWMGMNQRVVLRTIELLADRVRPLVESALASEPSAGSKVQLEPGGPESVG